MILLLITLSIFLFPSKIQAQEIIQQENPYTVFDGVSWEKYVSYLKLDGTQGVQLPVDSLKIGDYQEYTLMLWFKPNGVNWNKRFHYAFEFDSSLECYFTATSQLMCDSIQKCEKLEVDVSTIGQNQWSHIALVGHPSYGSSLKISQNLKQIGQDQKDYIVLAQQKQSWSVCLGGCQEQYSFVGGMREFIFINKYVSIETTQRLKNTYLLWDTSIIAYYRFSEDKFYKDEFQNKYAKITYSKNSSLDIIGRDYIPNDICFPIKETNLFYKFSSDTQDISQLQIDNRWSPLKEDWSYSLSVWVKIDDTSCTNSNPYNAQSKCFLVLLKDAFMLYQPRRNTVSLFFFNQKPYYEYQSKGITVPENQWVNIQFAINQYDGYEIRAYDLLGRLMDRVQETRNLQDQSIDKKTIDLFRNFQGIAKSLILYTTQKPLPITMPSLNDTNTIITDTKCLVYFKFTEDSIIQRVNQTSSRVVNYCKLKTQTYLNGTINKPTTFVSSYTADYAYGSQANDGSIKTNQTLFDGIACNDSSRSNEFLSSESQITAQTQNFSSHLTTLTVEFWFKLNSELSMTNTLFSLWGNKNYKNQYTSILFNKTNQNLICNPYGTQLDPKLQNTIYYLFLTEQSRVAQGWMHIVCQFDSSTTKRVNGYIYTKNAQVNYTKTMTTNLTIPRDEYIITLGSTLNNSNDGTPNMLIKELRVWAVNRTYSEISYWRNRQLDPRRFTSSQLMIYLRLAEDNYQEINFASIISTTIPSKVQQTGIRYKYDNELTICPINTYQATSYDRTIKCYQDPVKVLVATVYLYKDNEKDGDYYWVFDSSQSLLVNQDYAKEIKISWTFNDEFIQEAIQNQSSNAVMQLPTTLFRDENSYSVRLTYTNTDQTFTSIKDITFIPISCKLYVANKYTANSYYQNYTQPQATEDINFTLDPITVQSYCSDISFYDSLKYKVNYQFVPPLNYSLELNVSYDSSGKISVTIPKYQQYKIPVQVDQKIIFSIFYTSLLYGELMNVDDLTFQNVIYTINFNSQGKVVIPQLFALNDRVLMGENAILNASNTYITNSTDSQKQQGLTFSWQCPQNLELLCSGKSGSILNISTSDFDKAGGIYNKSYTFFVKVQWTHTTSQSNNNASTNSNGNSNTGSSSTQIDYFYTQTTLSWFNVYVPSFKLITPATVKQTSDNQFSLVLDYYNNTNITKLNISWSFVPNLSVPLNLTKNNTLLTVRKGGFLPLETYTLTVKVTHKQLNFTNKSKSVTFTTSSPPTGGTVSINPTFGYVGDDLTVTLKNWKSSNPPITYRVWSTSNPGGTVNLKQLTSTWISDSQNFTFTAPNTNPFIVEITDLSNEIVTQKLIPAISEKPASTNYTWNVTQMISIFEDNNTTTTSKYSYMSQYVDFMNNQSNTSNQQNSQIQAREIVIDQILKDIKMINDQKYIENGESQVIIENSLQMINSMTIYPQYLNDYIINSVLLVMDNLKSTKQQFEETIFNDDVPLDNYIYSISNLLKYSSFKQMTNKVRRLYSYDSSNIHGLINLNQQLKNMLDDITIQICNQQISEMNEKDIRTDSFNILIKQLSQYSLEENKQFLSPDDSKTRVNVDYKDIIKSLSLTSPNTKSICAISVFYKQPIVINAQSQITQHSQSFIEFKIAEQQSYNPQDMVSFYFKVNPKTFKSNQTVCMAYMNKTQQWNDDSCITLIDKDKVEVECQCNLLDSLYTGVFTDSSRQLGSQINFAEEFTESQSINYQPFESIENSVAFTAIIAILFIFSTAIPTISIILDKRDQKVAKTSKLGQQQMKQLKKLSKLSHQPIEYWKLKNEEVMNYSIRSKSLFSHILSAIHPFISVLTYFDAGISRITRFSLYFLQISIFAFICINVFGPSYREKNQDRVQEGLQMVDINNIIAVGIVGMLILLPIPNNFLKSKDGNNKKSIKIKNEIINNSEHLQQSKSINGENTQNKFQPNINDIILTKSTRFDQQLNSAKNFNNQEQSDTIAQQYSIQPLCKAIKYIIIITSYLVSLIALVLVVVYSTIVPVANQYCMVTSFYIGFFGSIFVTNIVRVIINTILADMIVNTGKLKWLSIFISSESIRIVREIDLVRKAEAILNNKSQTNLFLENNEQEDDEEVKEDESANDFHKCDSKSLTFMPKAIEKADSELNIFNGQISSKQQEDPLFTVMSPGIKLKGRNSKPQNYDYNIESSNEYQNNIVKSTEKQQRQIYSNILGREEEIQEQNK